jgi:transcriptional regulator of acetoin/glycerol metabolism
MASRSIAGQLARFLHALAAPVCVFDEDRRVVFANQACADWTAAPLDELIGKAASYTAVSKDEERSAVDRLCPPPEAFVEHNRSGLVYAHAENQLRRRRAQFLRLGGGGAPAPVIVVADAQDLPPGDRSDDDAALPLAADEAGALHDRLMRLQHDQIAFYRLDRLVGDSVAMRLARSQARLAIASGASLAVVGPAGSGREHVARVIHYSAQEKVRAEGATAEKPVLLPLDGTLLTPEVLISAIAGLSIHSRNTAVTVLILHLDAITIVLQSELVRLLGTRLTQVRFLATSELPPDLLLAEGRLHPHLAPAIGTLTIRLPPLVERREDIPLLAQLAIEELNSQGRKQMRGLAAEALDVLVGYSWPGNVAELRGCVTEAFAQAEGHEITVADLPRRLFQVADAVRRPARVDEPIDLEDFLKNIEREIVERAMKQARGNKARAARLLGLTRPRLYRRMVQLGLVDTAALDSGSDGPVKAPDRTERRAKRQKPKRRKPITTLPAAEFGAPVADIEEEPEYIENIPFEEQPE